MLNAKSIIRFGITSFIIYLILILAGTYTSLGKKYANGLRNNAANFFSKEAYKISFKKIKQEKYDTRIELSDKKKGIQSACSFNIWMAGFLPTALIFSLILATPISTIKRKLIVLFLGFLLISIYIWIGIRIKISVLHQQIAKAEQTFNNSITNRAIEFVNTAIIDPVSMIFLIPVFIWGLLAFRKSDFV